MNVFTPLELQYGGVGELPIAYLGTPYGGWAFQFKSHMVGGVAVCAGAGCDISFEVELARRLHMTVIIVDPTPIAKDHVKEVLLGRDRDVAHLPLVGAYQRPSSYQLDAASRDRILFEDVALSDEDGHIYLYRQDSSGRPADPSLSSKRRRGASGRSLLVESRSLQSLIELHQIDRLDILKLDIEGAEYDVIESLRGISILPRQVLVEFDDLLYPSRASRTRVRDSLRHLERLGYELVYFDGVTNACYELRR